MTMKIETDVMLSNHHVHLSESAAKQLFGEKGITMKNWTNDSHVEFAANETVTVSGPKGSISNVRVLGPCRGVTQVELLFGDNYKLGTDAPVRMSGDLSGAAELRITGTEGSVTEACGIVAMRHIHLGYETADALGLKNGEECCVKFEGPRAVTFDHVVLRVSKKVARDAMMHIDTEEGNAAGIKNHSRGVILVKK